jgi:hypothetical protein
MTLAKAKLASSITFIVLASFTIVTYDRQNMFIIQARGVDFKIKFWSKFTQYFKLDRFSFTAENNMQL